MRRLITAMLLVALLPALAAAQDGGEPRLRPISTRVLVKFTSWYGESLRERVAERAGAELIELGPYADFALLRFDEAPGEEGLARILESTGVVWAELEARYATSRFAPAMLFDYEDPLQPLQWSFRMIGMRAAHDMNFGADPGVTVAVLDTGIAYMTAGRLRQAPDLSGAIVLSGYDFVSDDDLALDEGDGSVGHGTFTAGVIAQTTHNGRGTAGIAFNASLLPVRVADRRGVARASNLARGIRFAVANGASLIVLGVAGPDESRAVADAVRFAYESGVPVIAPAGNEPAVQFPARLPEVFSVGAVDANGERAYYSPEEGPVDLYAPGGDMRPGIDANGDGLPDGVIAESFTERNFRAFGPVLMEGTSAASAHVAGAAALLLSQVGPLPPERLYRALRAGSRRFGQLHVVDAARLLLHSAEVGK